MNHGHASELIIKCGNVKRKAVEILDSEEHGLLSVFLDTKELIICHKAAGGLLLNEDLFQCTPTLCGVILVCSDVDSLVRYNIEHDLASCPVLLHVPSSLVWVCNNEVRFFVIHKLPETLGVK